MKLTNKQKAAKKRIQVAISHLEKVRVELDAACADLSTVMGGGAFQSFNMIKKLSMSTIDVRRELNFELNDIDNKGATPWQLDHEPTPQELRCGHGPMHGCGRGKKR